VLGQTWFVAGPRLGGGGLASHSQHMFHVSLEFRQAPVEGWVCTRLSGANRVLSQHSTLGAAGRNHQNGGGGKGIDGGGGSGTSGGGGSCGAGGSGRPSGIAGRPSDTPTGTVT
jgi:hypothetical protein